MGSLHDPAQCQQALRGACFLATNGRLSARLERNEPRITQMGTDDPSKLGLAEKKRNSRKSAGRVFVFDLPDSRCECTRALDFSLWSLCPLWLNKVLVHSNIIIILNPAAGINRRFRREHRLNQLRIKYCSNTIHPQGECLELCLVLVIRAYLGNLWFKCFFF